MKPNDCSRAAVSVAGLACALAALLVPSAPTAAASATIKTVPPQFVCPGVDYVMHVVADNTGLNGEKTDMTEFRIYNPCYNDGSWEYIPGFSVTLGGPNSDGLPANDDDFFKDVEMFSGWNFVSLPGNKSTRLAQGGGNGPANKIGDVAVYNFNLLIFESLM